jgi:hypothetical protein
MPTLEATLKSPRCDLHGADIMTGNPDLVCGANERDAASKSEANPDFDVIPIQRDGVLIGYFERETCNKKRITASDLISDGTSLLDLVDILQVRPFAFVLSRERVEGYVHFSDLNHQLVKLTFYVILEALERLGLNSIRGRDDRDSLKRDLDPVRFKQIEDAYKRTGQAARSLVSYLNLSDILRLADSAGAIHIEESLITEMKSVRDGSAHVSENLVSIYDGVSKLGRVKRECLRVLGST